MSELTKLLHLLMCQRPHAEDMHEITNRRESECYFYLEENIAECSDMPDHKEWTQLSREFIDDCGFENEQDAVDFMRKSLLISKEVHELSRENRSRTAFILELLS